MRNAPGPGIFKLHQAQPQGTQFFMLQSFLLSVLKKKVEEGKGEREGEDVSLRPGATHSQRTESSLGLAT